VAFDNLLLLDPRYLQPLPKALWGVACSCCHRTVARWGLLDPALRSASAEDSLLALCSWCFLYKSEWGKRRQEDIKRLIKDTEDAMGAVFEKSEDSCLVKTDDADRILGSIAFVSRLVEMKVRAE
jgi:hypothetical protein